MSKIRNEKALHQMYNKFQFSLTKTQLRYRMFCENQKQSPRGVLWKGCSQTWKKGFRPATLLKKRLWHSIDVFLWILQNLYKHFSYRTPPVAASGKLLAFIWKDCCWRFRFFGIRKFEKDLLSRALVDGPFRFFLSFSWIFTKAIQILKRQSEERSW